MNTQAKVAQDKAKHPERFCPEPRCLWKTAKLNHETQTYEGGGYCPRHNPRNVVRRKRHQAIDLGLVRVRGALGGVYYE